MSPRKSRMTYFLASLASGMGLCACLVSIVCLVVAFAPHAPWGPFWPLGALVAAVLLEAEAIVWFRRVEDRLDAVSVEKEGLVAGTMSIVGGGAIIVFADGDFSTVKFDLEIDDGLYVVVRRNGWGGLAGLEVRHFPPPKEGSN